MASLSDANSKASICISCFTETSIPVIVAAMLSLLQCVNAFRLTIQQRETCYTYHNR